MKKTSKKTVHTEPLSVRQIVSGMSKERFKTNRDLGKDPEEDSQIPQQNVNPAHRHSESNPVRGNGNDTLHDATPPSVEGEQSVSGDMPDPESDDDTLENAHDMGFALDADDEHPKPLDMGSDIDKAEEKLRKK